MAKRKKSKDKSDDFVTKAVGDGDIRAKSRKIKDSVYQKELARLQMN